MFGFGIVCGPVLDLKALMGAGFTQGPDGKWYVDGYITAHPATPEQRKAMQGALRFPAKDKP